MNTSKFKSGDKVKISVQDRITEICSVETVELVKLIEPHPLLERWTVKFLDGKIRTRLICAY